MEDDQGERWLLSEVLRSRGHHVVATTDAASAWDAFLASPFSLVVLDLALPNADGLELCRRMREHARGTDAVILAITGKTDPDVPQELLASDVGDYVVKPIDVALLNIRLTAAEREVRRKWEHRTDRLRLAVQDEEIRSLLADLDAVIFSLDPLSGSLLRVSPSALRILGHAEPELIADESLWRALLYPPEVEVRQKELSHERDRAIVHRWQIQLPSGSARWVEVTVKGERDSAGTLVRVDGVLSDVTEAQRSQEELAARNTELMTLYRISEVILTAASTERAYEEILEELCKATSFPIAAIERYDAKRERLTILAARGLPPEHSQLEMPIHETLAGVAVRTGQPLAEFNARARPEMANDLLYGLDIQTYLAFPMVVSQQVVAALILAHTQTMDPDRKLVRWAGSLANGVAQLVDRIFTQDALRESEQRHRRLAEELQQANQELERFAYSVAHDLRAPLRTMQGFSHALLQNFGDGLPSEARDYAQRIIASGQQAEILIRDLLAYSRLSFEDLEVRRVALTKVVAEARERLEGDLKEAGADLSVDGELPDVLGQTTTLVQVVTNLISNAIKFVPPGGRPRIRIQAEEGERWVRLSVQDNGIGIPPGQEERIFRVFERLGKCGAQPGTGIGLAIVRRGMERMGGQCGVETDAGDEGSRFWLDIPRVEGGPSRAWRRKKG